MLAIDLEKLADNIGDSSVEPAQELHGLVDRVSELGADLHSLSHSLHSSTLETLGLTAGVRAFCEEFAEQQGMQVDFVHENVPHGIPADAALCLFRIAQEGLRNVKRHSGAERAEVGGYLEIHSRPMEGARIDAWLPFKVAGERDLVWRTPASANE